MPYFDDPPRDNPVFGKFELACTHPGCLGKKKIEQAHSAGLAIGSIVPEDPGDPNFARCPHCKRHKMKVVAVPVPPAPKGPKGWTRVPTK